MAMKAAAQVTVAHELRKQPGLGDIQLNTGLPQLRFDEGKACAAVNVFFISGSLASVVPKNTARGELQPASGKRIRHPGEVLLTAGVEEKRSRELIVRDNGETDLHAI